jgi:hypothetical protein
VNGAVIHNDELKQFIGGQMVPSRYVYFLDPGDSCPQVDTDLPCHVLDTEPGVSRIFVSSPVAAGCFSGTPRYRVSPCEVSHSYEAFNLFDIIRDVIMDWAELLENLQKAFPEDIPHPTLASGEWTSSNLLFGLPELVQDSDEDCLVVTWRLGVVVYQREPGDDNTTMETE